jgi:hypothetical protein
VSEWGARCKHGAALKSECMSMSLGFRVHEHQLQHNVLSMSMSLGFRVHAHLLTILEEHVLKSTS